MNKKTARSITILALTCLAGIHLAQAQTFTRGSIEQNIKEIRDAMPGEGSNGFVIPTNQQLDVWGNVFNALKTGNYGTVPALVAPYEYSFFTFLDTLQAETLYVLKENIPVHRGWGTYIIKPHGRNDLTIEIPHPRFDTNTCIMGIRTFLKLDALWFFMAGTNRYANPDTSADMAHVTQSAFYKGHVVIATARTIQLHGFDRTNPIYNGYPMIVISNGTTSPPAILSTLKAGYESRGLTAGVFSTSTYSQLWRLGATQNVEGIWSNANGKAFVHCEHELPIRLDSIKIATAMAAMYETFTPPSSVTTPNAPVSFALEQNYPNPFNPETRIGFRIARSGFVTLTVSDMLGREIVSLVHEQLNPGTYTATFAAGNMPTGVYFYTLTSKGSAATKRMLLLK